MALIMIGELFLSRQFYYLCRYLCRIRVGRDWCIVFSTYYSCALLTEPFLFFIHVDWLAFALHQQRKEFSNPLHEQTFFFWF